MRTGAVVGIHVVAVAALCAVTCVALAAPPKEIFVTREAQDFYRVASGPLYIKTTNCQEFVYGDRATLRFNIGAKGGALTFRSGRACVIEKLYREMDPHAPDTFSPSLDASIMPSPPTGPPAIR